MSRRASPAAVGAFVLGGIAIALAALIALGGGGLFAETFRASIFFEQSVNGLVIGSPVKLEGVPVGQVVDIRAIVKESGPPSSRTYRTFSETVIEIDETRFEQLGDADDATQARQRDDNVDIERAVDSGVRAQLNLQSLLTGQLFIALMIDRDRPGYTGPERLARYEQIPTLPTAFDELEARVRQAFERLREIPLEELFENTNETLTAIRDLARDPAFASAATELEKTLRETRQLVRNASQQVEPVSAQAIAALEELETTLAAAQRSIEPGSPVLYQLGSTLQEITQAAQAIRALANAIERQPNALVFGKAEEGK